MADLYETKKLLSQYFGEIRCKKPNRGDTSPPPTPKTPLPYATTTSVVAIKFDKGVTIAGDTLVSYNSLAKYYGHNRIVKINENIILGCSGDYADYQSILSKIEELTMEDYYFENECNRKLTPGELHTWLTRIIYGRRNELRPLWNSYVIGGIQRGQPFLGTVDKLGTAYTDRVVATGLGGYLATPLIREYLNPEKPDPTQAEAEQLIRKCMEVMFYRDSRSSANYQIGTIDTDKNLTISSHVQVKQNWEIANLAKNNFASI